MTGAIPALRISPLDQIHTELGATFTEFAGWRLPLRYAGELIEHRAVRAAAGLFDISHMGQIVVTGADSSEALSAAVVTDIRRLRIGAARYTMICNHDGGVIDDLIIYRVGEIEVLVVANAANTRAVYDSLTARLIGYEVRVADRTRDRALLSLQGPSAVAVLQQACEVETCLPGRFQFEFLKVAGYRALVARTGYTGEDGFEISVELSGAAAVWRALLGSSVCEVLPAGLSARDSLRLEAGLPLYGHELSTARTPFDASYGSMVDFEHEFVGSHALRLAAASPKQQVLVGLRCHSQRSPRQGHTVLSSDGVRVGEVTSGGPSPTLGVPVAMAYVEPAAAELGTTLLVDVRGRLEAATVVRLPFFRRQP